MIGWATMAWKLARARVYAHPWGIVTPGDWPLSRNDGCSGFAPVSSEYYRYVDLANAAQKYHGPITVTYV